LRFSSQGTEEFWKLYRDLPLGVRQVARKNYRRWQADPFHPSLHFKKVGRDNWSIRVGLSYRAIGLFMENGAFVWQWIGTHAEYDRKT
jgi:hypothetical protein